MELSLGLWENFAAISVLVVSYVKCNGKREDSLAVARAVIQHIILAAILAMLDDLDTKPLAVALSPIIPSIIVLVRVVCVVSRPASIENIIFFSSH